MTLSSKIAIAIIVISSVVSTGSYISFLHDELRTSNANVAALQHAVVDLTIKRDDLIKSGRSSNGIVIEHKYHNNAQ